MSTRESSVPLHSVSVAAYRIPTDAPEADGTLAWNSTTMVLVQLEGGGKRGIGYGYADSATATLIHDRLAPLLLEHNAGRDALATNACWLEMVKSIRNLGRPGICSMAIAAVDAALWDLKAKLLELPLAALLGKTRDAIPVYGSGGFTSYSSTQLWQQLHGWIECGITRVKMKIGSEPERDLERVRSAREAIGPAPQLFVDANGAYERKQALAFAHAFRDFGVAWFEEPVSSDDLDGLRLLRDQGPPGMAISAGEYGYDLPYFRRMLEARAVDVLQADATRCAGITGWLGVAALCEAYNVPLSSHCAPMLHLPLCCAARPAIHLEYFHDHVRIEHMLFDGAIHSEHGGLAPDMSRPGLGIAFRERDAECYRI
ncbi:enolase C-terminal domain-like protein [Noviherbaspirillum massiliense]|uniref:enolase C-terminal domain-like protein n=1 Tax=Noviherbaspirillum massiliense TaxID=1465823 RepID=UPI0002F25FC4|nr:enolase C-terminal domain-like protein [Noviherbaspirillum massiliense]